MSFHLLRHRASRLLACIGIGICMVVPGALALASILGPGAPASAVPLPSTCFVSSTAATATSCTGSTALAPCAFRSALTDADSTEGVVDIHLATTAQPGYQIVESTGTAVGFNLPT